MTDFALIVTGESELPTVVRLHAGDSALDLIGSRGADSIPWWRLYRVGDDRATHCFRRLDQRNWELRVTSGADRDLLARVGRRPFHRLIHPLRRLQALKIFAGVLIIAVTIAQHAPPELLAKSVPAWARHRLVDGMVAQQAPRRCSHDGGEAALRKLVTRLDPQLGGKVDLVALRDGGFLVSSIPDDRILMLRSSLSEIDAAALPALLAHQLSHIRHDDPMVAILRENGLLKTWGAILEGGSQGLPMQFSGIEERRADLEAMQMMRNAGMPLRPAAEMYEQMRVSSEQGGFFGYGQRDFHFGIDGRAPRWAAAARSDPPNAPPTLTGDDLDALFNFCWTGPIPPLSKSQPTLPRTVPPGAGTLGPSSPVK